MTSIEYYEKIECRLCSGAVKGPVFDLGMVPISNSLSTDPSQPDPTYPLQLMQCEDCGHVQTSVVVREDLLFPKDYPYRSGTNPVMRKHLHDYALEIAEQIEGRKVLEIGSNDGTLLEELEAQGFEAFGVDPARDAADESDVLTLPMPFGSVLARTLRKVDCVVANHCLAHIDDLQDVLKGVRRLLRDDGVFVMEVGYLGSMTFDCCYLEHLSYHALIPLVKFLRRRGLYLYKWEQNGIQGGSIRVWSSTIERDEYTYKCVLGNGETVKLSNLRDQVDRSRAALEPLLSGRFAIYGAPAKLTTMLAAVPMLQRAECIYDDNPEKQGKWTPATHIPIVCPENLIDGRPKPDTLVLASWNFFQEIVPRLRKAGFTGKVVMPTGEVPYE